MFKFELDQVITDKEVLDLRTVVGRFLDCDQNNIPVYVLMKQTTGRIEILSAQMTEDCFKAASEE